MDSITARPARSRWRRLAAVAIGVTIAAGGVVATAAAPATAEDCSAYPWMDTSKTADQRAHALLAASTQNQKYRWLVEQPANSPLQTTFSGVVYPVQVPCTPTVVYTDGADAVRRTAGTTAFPAPIAMAATFDPDLVEAKSVAQAVESFQNRKNVILGPGIASGRTPLSGRNSEYLGEDPLLSGALGAAAIRGYQFDDDQVAVLATPKHYVANEQELDRQTSSSNIDERTFHQVYALPYEIADEAGPESTMCSYNQINGVYACENPYVIGDTLKRKIGFDGYVMSDFGSVHTTAGSLKAGMDQELNRPIWYTPARLDASLAAKEITQADIETAAFRVVRSYIRGGLFDHPLPTAVNPNSSTPEHKAIARELAEEGTVLLKNDGALPLAPAAGDTVALFGPTASATPTNGISATSVCSMFNRNSNTSICEALVSPQAAITTRAGQDGAAVTFNAGTDVAAAAAAAAQADVAVVFGYKRMGEFADPTSLALDGNGDALISAVAAANPNTIVVIQAGSAVEMPWIDDVKAVFHAWYPGEQMGPALASLLWGDVNPSGKLPMTLPEKLADTPTGSDPARYPGIFSDGTTTRPAGTNEIRQVNYTEGLQVGYKWYDEQGIDPLFEFGHGLSYTSFEYSDLKVKVDRDRRTNERATATVSFTVTNTGERDGAEVPQVYLTLPDAANEPGKRLVAFDRIQLAAGESTRVELVVDSAASSHPFSIWDVDADKWVSPKGRYDLAVGSSSRDIRLTDSLQLNITMPAASANGRG
ncbi:beta-glucosidase [Agromyces sp. NPDC057865]|uniref:beta-glucosidase n=1 Tax=Agromyces sp. NPDC057865 TaxID=3346267 RepID=UPI00366C589F